MGADATARDPGYPAAMGKPRALRTFAPDTVAAIRSLAARADADPSGAVGALTDLTWRGLDGRGAGHDLGLLVEADDGAPVAYAHLATEHTANEHTRQWTIELLDRRDDVDATHQLLADALDLVREDGHAHVTLWADTVGGKPDALTRIAAHAALAPERELLQLRVALPIGEAHWPTGIAVRTFEAGRDEAAWVGVNNRAFAGHPEQGDWTTAMLVAREHEPWFDPSGFLLAFDGDTLAGFCWTKVHAADPPREPSAMGEIYVIGVDPAFQGTGLGRALVAGGLGSLAARGVTLGMLYVDAANAAAVGLYHALGFVEHSRHVAYATVVEPPR